jgi:ABC-type antimicrobial peptide transport system permease subunit
LGSGIDVLGRRIRIGPGETPWLEIVGVVGDVDAGTSMVSFGERPGSQIYLPYGSEPAAALTITVRSDESQTRLAPAIREAIRQAAPGVPVADLLTIDQAIERVQWVAAYFGRLFATYALIALVIAALGAYGIVADTVARQTREMGIRMALGARPRQLLLKVVAQGIGLGIAGVALGTLLAVPASRVMGAMLIDVNVSDPRTFVGVGALLLTIAGLASYLPARQAARLDPSHVLRLD